MSAVPRIVRAAPRGKISTPEIGLPVMVQIRWYTGEVVEIPAVAVAWTRDAVEIQWEAPDFGMRQDWLPATDVRRPDARGQRSGDPPRARPQDRKRQW